MRFDLGLEGLAILAALSLTFGAVTHFLGKPAIRGEWLIAAAGWFVGGLFFSEVLFAEATVGEIQPIIGGLAFDEALLGGLLVGLGIWLVTRFLTGGSPFRHRPVSP